MTTLFINYFPIQIIEAKNYMKEIILIAILTYFLLFSATPY